MTKGMNTLIKLEELGQFLLSVAFFAYLDYSWWVFPACLLLPDLSMIGYLAGTKAGARLYNVFHHKLVAVLVLLLGCSFGLQWVMLTGVIFFGHSAMDRFFGFGLKFDDSFRTTHLGRIGKKDGRRG